MDKSWIHLKDRTSQEYFLGVEKFLNFAFTGKPVEKCPCKKCKNRFFHTKEEIKGHLIWNGFWSTYTQWTVHGEDPLSILEGQSNGNQNDNNVRDDVFGMLHDAMGVQDADCEMVGEQFQECEYENKSDEETKKFMKLLEDAQRPLYEGGELSSLSFLVQLLNIKVMCNMTDKAVTEILNLLHKAFPNATFAKSYYEAKKITSDLGFGYETWDVCKNNCMIYRNEDKDLDKCVICEHPRYKQVNENRGNTGANMSKAKKIPEKQMRYFPLIPRLKRLFMSRHTSSLMKWHSSEEHLDDGVMRHPSDSPAWKAFDEQYPEFASEPRNVRLGLASDGFNPFGNMSSAYSTWPVVLIPYNLPPLLCMKQHNFILSTLIDGPNGPGDKIDVYLQPLIDELKELWTSGVDAYDASSKQTFKLHAALLWTINDFPALANLMVWSTKGRLACPCCNKKTKSRWLKHGKKFCYMGHRRWLERSNKLRRDKLAFDGEQEWDNRPEMLSGAELLMQLNDVETIYKKEDIFSKREREAFEKEELKKSRLAQSREKRKRKAQVSGKGKRGIQSKGSEAEGNVETKKTHNWKKKSIFFELPYWVNNLIRHCLDVMHIEKNMCDNILNTLLGTTKSKDSFKARLDMKIMGIRKSLHPKDGLSGSKKLPQAIFTMSRAEKNIFLKVLKNIRVPDGYASNISRRVDLGEGTISGLKSHDNHILLQQLLPLAIRKALPSKVVKVLIEVTNFFRQLCSKATRKADLEDIQKRIELALCHLEKIFPPAFFDIMVHLPIHLAEEAMIAGPVQFRWMYPIERYLKTLKRYVRNRARPEASIAQGYILDECMTFCGRYLYDVDTKSNPRSRYDDGGENLGCHYGKADNYRLSHITRQQAHRYVLANSDIIDPYREAHLSFLRKSMPRASDRQLHNIHNEQFPNWFRDYVNNIVAADHGIKLSDEVMKLAAGPTDQARRFSGYDVNGFRFRTKAIDNSKSTCNSGIYLDANLRSYASTKDKNPISGDVTFYGELIDVIEIDYTRGTKYVLFKCDWIDSNKGMRVDGFNLTSVNFNHLLYKDNKATDEPFILASQARQAIYVQDPVDVDWHVVLKMNCRDCFDMVSHDNSLVMVPQVQSFSIQQLDVNRMLVDDDSVWVKEGGEEVIVDSTIVAKEYADIDDMDESDDANDSTNMNEE